MPVVPGDVLHFVTWGGGGWGDPLERDPELVAQFSDPAYALAFARDDRPVVADREILGGLHPGEHGSTFGGNPLACSAAINSGEKDRNHTVMLKLELRTLGEVRLDLVVEHR